MIATRLTSGTLRGGLLRRSLSGQPPRATHRSQSGRASMVFFGIPIAITTALGIWQVRRLDGKRTQIELRTERLNMKPLDGIPEDAALAESQYCRVTVRGKFRPDGQVAVGPRSMPHLLPPELTPQVGSVGYYLLAPLEQADGSVVIINRGWIPQNPREFHRVQPVPDGETEVMGILRQPERQKMATPDNAPEKGDWFWIDVPAVLEHAQAHGPNCYVEALPPSEDRVEDLGLPFPKAVDDHINFFVDPFTHVVYAVTWFSLAIFMATVAYSKRYGRLGRTTQVAERLVDSAR